MNKGQQQSDQEGILQESRQFVKEQTGVSVEGMLEIEGYETQEDMVAAFFTESIVPAMCIHGCQIEQDGMCKHGHHSIISEILGI